MKKMRILTCLLAVTVVGGILFAASGTIVTWTGTGSRNNTVEWTIESPTVGTAAELLPGADNANDIGSVTKTLQNLYSTEVTAYGIDFTTGTALIDTESRGIRISAYLAGTVDAEQGDLLIGDAPVGDEMAVRVASATTDLTSWVGIAVAATSTGSAVAIYTYGYVHALTTGAVNPGDTLVSSNTETGYLGADTTPTTGADVGVAMEYGTAAGGLTLIRLR